MPQSDLHKLLDKVLKARGSAPVEAALGGLLASGEPRTQALTIVANAEVSTKSHPLIFEAKFMRPVVVIGTLRRKRLYQSNWSEFSRGLSRN